MSDAEWERFKATFKQGGRPMPSIVKRAESDRRRMIVGFVGIYVIAGGLLAFALPALWVARGLVEAAPLLVVVAVSIAVVITTHVSMRGGWRDDGATPRALLDALERRHAGRRRTMRWMPWLLAATVLGTLGSATLLMIAAGQFQAGLAARVVGKDIVTVAFVWIVLRTTRRKIDRELREVTEARRLLGEDEAQR